jgi:hypothetical protein
MANSGREGVAFNDKPKHFFAAKRWALTFQKRTLLLIRVVHVGNLVSRLCLYGLLQTSRRRG